MPQIIRDRSFLLPVEDDKEFLWQASMPRISVTNTELPVVYYRDGEFDFKLRRIARYREPNASRLLKAFSHFLSRDADDHDFAKV